MAVTRITDPRTDPTTGWSAVRSMKGSKAVITVSLDGATVCTIGGNRAARASVVVMQHFLEGHGKGHSYAAGAALYHGKTNVDGCRAKPVPSRHVTGPDTYGFPRDYLEWGVPVADA